MKAPITAPVGAAIRAAVLVLLASCGEDSASLPADDTGADARDVGGASDLATADAGDAVEDAASDATDASEADASDVSGDAHSRDTVSGDVEGDTGSDSTTAPDEGPVGPTALSCFAGQLPDDGIPTVDYDALSPVIGSHCMGTNHQDITGVERVVFVGDSITVGSPPTLQNNWYRNVLATSLASHFGLEPAGGLWPFADVVNGVALAREGGDFASCAKWGARTDDIAAAPHFQMQTCIPEGERDKRTLIVMTVGGNDIFAWAQDYVDGETAESLREAAEAAVADIEAAIHWAVDDPALFPNGVFVVFATPFDLTDPDGARDMSECTGAGVISMDTALVDPVINDLAAYMSSEYMRIAVETGTDLVFMGEHFCGNGANARDRDGRCYRGGGAGAYFDVTCMHPSAQGHGVIADLFYATITE